MIVITIAGCLTLLWINKKESRLILSPGKTYIRSLKKLYYGRIKQIP